MSEVYFVIRSSHGYSAIDQYMKEDLLKMLDESDKDKDLDWFSELPDARNMQRWDYGKLLIIKGEVVAPFPKTVVKKYDIE